MPGDQVHDRLGDVGRMVADPFDVLRAKEQMRAERDVAWILHHVGQEIAENRIFQRIEIDVALPDFARALAVTLRVCVELLKDVLDAYARSLSRCAYASSTSLRSSVATSFMCFRPTIARG